MSIGKQASYYVGLMSGTSLDGIDAAVVSLAGDDVELICFETFDIKQKLKEPILHLNQPGFHEIDTMGVLDRELGLAFANAALQVVEKAGLQPFQIIAIGSHGQTIRHRPQGVDNSLPFTLQIGDAATIAEKTGITVVSNFRKRDIAACGQGAPLVPYVHQRLFAEQGKNIAVVNIGGIANITYLGGVAQSGENTVLGFDTGPGNMVMDALMQTMTDARFSYDKNGELAATGKVCQPLLTDLLKHSFFKKIPPRSTGREDFGDGVVHQIMAVDIPDADKMATACELTAQSIVSSLNFLPEKPNAWLLCGGGALNTHLKQRLTALLDNAKVQTTADIGLPVEAVEAVAFAMLAERTLQGEHNTLSAVTGALHDVCGGQISPGKNWGNILKA